MAIRTNAPINPEANSFDPEAEAASAPETKMEAPTEPDPKAEAKAPETPPEAAAPPQVRQEAGDLDRLSDPGNVMPTIQSLRDAWDPETFGNMFPRVVGTNGELYCNGNSFGKWIDIQVYSHSARYFVTPVSDPKDKDAKYYCRASYDNKTIPDRDGGEPMTIAEYQESIKDEYPETNISKYHDIYAIILGSDQNAELAKKANIVQVSVSKTAVKGFLAFAMQGNVMVIRGQMLPTHQNCVRVKAKPMSSNDGQNYVIMEFEAIPLDVVVNYTPVVAPSP